MQLPVIDPDSPIQSTSDHASGVFKKNLRMQSQGLNGIEADLSSEDLFGLIKNMCRQVQSSPGWIGWVAPYELPCRSIFIAYDLPLERFLLIHPRVEVQTLDVALKALQNEHIAALVISVRDLLPHQRSGLKAFAQQSFKPTILLQHEQGVKNQQSIQLSVKDYFAFHQPTEIDSFVPNSQLTLFS
ncbi:MAG TPA: hypothetical protein DCZ03_11715 [Gammaproteobacteria bacterium]|nr:hypothetical protein [Gammaproteobacteria bacterium]